MSVVDVLIDKVADLPELPPDIEASARLHFLDAVGVGLAATRRGPVRELPSTVATTGPCTVLGADATTSPAEAALVNGTLIHSLEYDDTHTGSVMHGSSVLAPAVLAAAEDTGADGRQVIKAFAVGWEVLVRLGLASPSGFQRVGFQGTSVAGPLAGALAVGLINGLDRERLADAIGVAASFAAGNFTFLASGATSKAAQAGIAAQAAVSAVRLVGGGVTGARTVFEGERGFFGLYARDAAAAERFQSSLEDLGTRWYLAEAAFKGLPCCHFLHPFVEAVAELNLGPGGHERLQRLTCHVPTGQEHVIAVPWERKQSPERADEARWSLPYVVALQAVRGQVDLDDFVGEPDPEVVRFAQRVTWEPWPDSGYPARFPAKLEAVWDDGSRQLVRIPDVDGNGSRPWDATRVIAKFRDNCAAAGVDPASTDSVAEAIVNAAQPDLAVVRRLAGRA